MENNEDFKVVTYKQLKYILDRITFRPSCVNMGWKWEVNTVYSHGCSDATGESYYNQMGWLVNTTFQRPDTNTGDMGTGKGRQEFIPYGATVSGVVKTSWLLAELIVRHELMEAFCFDGQRVFDPHKSVFELTKPGR